VTPDDVDQGDDRTLSDMDDVVDDPDEDAIDEESPRAADSDQYGWLEGNDGDVVIYDERNPWAWLSSADPDDLDDRE